MREAISASSVANAPAGGGNKAWDTRGRGWGTPIEFKARRARDESANLSQASKSEAKISHPERD